MNIDAYIRSKTSQYLRDLIIKDKCEVCDKDSDLELHHIKAFAVIMNECFESLGYDRHEDIESYTDTQLINITNWMLGAQLQSTYSTLCQTCHTDWHSEQGGFYKTTNKFDEYYRKKEIEDKLKEINRCQNVIKPYLESIIGKKLYKEEQKELKEVFKQNGLNARTTGINTINANMKDRDMPYILEIGKRKSYRDENKKIKKEKSHWILRRVKNLKHTG